MIATGCFALRRIGGKVYLFSDSHVGTGGAVYEFEPPEPAASAPYATAKSTKNRTNAAVVKFYSDFASPIGASQPTGCTHACCN